MKKIILGMMIMSCTLFAFEGALLKVLAKTFTKSTLGAVSQQYGKSGLKALKVLSIKYGKNSLPKLNKLYVEYGKKGLEMVSKYGASALKNRDTFRLVDKYGDKGFYLIKKYPEKSVAYYNKFGNTFVASTEKYGTKRVVKYLDQSAKFNQDQKVMKFLDKFGEKGNIFLDKHWGKLLTSGFVLLSADSIITSTENIARKGLDKAGDVLVDGAATVADSQLGVFIGIAIVLFVFFAFGMEKIIKLRKSFLRSSLK